MAMAASLGGLAAPLNAADDQHQSHGEIIAADPLYEGQREGDEPAPGPYLATGRLGTDVRPLVYVGTIGSDPIVMELFPGEYGSTGRFFYRKDRLDIGLQEMRDIDDLTSDELSLDAISRGSRMTLRRSSTGLSGWFTTEGTSPQPVSLSLLADAPLETGETEAPLASFAIYQRQQLDNLALVAGDSVQHGTRALREWREPVSGISLFRIEQGYPEPVMQKINSALGRYHWQRVSAWFDCDGEVGKSGYEVSEVSALFLSDDFVSLAWSEKVRCLQNHFGHVAHDIYTRKEGLTFSAQTGDEVHLDDVFYLGEGTAPRIGTNAWFDYRYKIFPARLPALLEKLHPQPVWQDKDCAAFNGVEGWEWGAFTWHLTSDGLYLEKQGRTLCDEPAGWRTIPWGHQSLRRPISIPVKAAAPVARALHFGQMAFTKSDIAQLSLILDRDNIAALEIALQPDAAKRLEVETTRLLNTSVNIAVGSTLLASPQLIDPVADGRLGLFGLMHLRDLQAMAGEIICAMHLSRRQFDPTNLAGSLPCEPK
ncbi:MAG: hypothetical protein EDM03_08665 [Porphyrobacter sp. IPPAS B-1204]|nr:MAG: hypothetical protein EDM03_08665 [Porphyrobacter sp. IPPAS B-1204]